MIEREFNQRAFSSMVSIAWIGLGEPPTTETGPYDLLGPLRTFVVHDDPFPQVPEVLCQGQSCSLGTSTEVPCCLVMEWPQPPRRPTYLQDRLRGIFKINAIFLQSEIFSGNFKSEG